MLVVSLTTIRSRLGRLDAILGSLLQQTRPPEAIVLSASHEPYLLDEGVHESDLERLVPTIGLEERIHVRFMKNLGSYRKILAALDFCRNDDDVFVTADDDIPYAPHWLERLVSRLRDDPVTPAYRCRSLGWTADALQPYEQWLFFGSRTAPGCETPRLDLLPTSGAGIAYRRGCFDADDPLTLLQQLAPMQDDIALRLLMLSKGIAVAWTPSDAEGRAFEEFNSYASALGLYRYNRRASWLGRTPNDRAIRRTAAFLVSRARTPEAREWLERIDRGSVLHRQLLRRLRELYWDYARSRRHRDSAR